MGQVENGKTVRVNVMGYCDGRIRTSCQSSNGSPLATIQTQNIRKPFSNQVLESHQLLFFLTVLNPNGNRYLTLHPPVV